MAQAYVFTFGAGLPANESVARWATCIAMAWNDIVFTHDLYVAHDRGGRGVYLVRVAAGHLSEALGQTGPFLAGHDDWPEVQAFVSGLSKRAREDFDRLRSVAVDREKAGTFGWQLDRLRNYVYHYPHLQAGQSLGQRLEIARVLRDKAKEEGSVSFESDAVKDVRFGFADEISINLAFARAGIDSSSKSELREFVKQLLGVQLSFIRFGELALDRYLKSLPRGTLRPE